MARIINDRPGFVVHAVNEPVAPTTTFRIGDLVKYQAGNTGNVVPAAVGDTALIGVSGNAITTGAAPDPLKERVLIEAFTAEGRYRGTLKNGVALSRNLIGTQAGFIDEGGEIRIDPAAAVKQVDIVDIAERPFTTTDPPEVKFMIRTTANRVR